MTTAMLWPDENGLCLPMHPRPDDVSPDKEIKACVSNIDGSTWKLRSKTYLKDKVKEDSKDNAFDLVGASVLRRKSSKISFAATDVAPLRRYLEKEASPDNFHCIVTWFLPGSSHHAVVIVWKQRLQRGEDAAFDNLVLDAFLGDDDAFRQERLKFLPGVPGAPWALRGAISSMGGERPAMICKKLAAKTLKEPGFCEVTIDVASSKVASALSGLILRASGGLTVDLGFTVEGRSEDELPERVLMSTRFHYVGFQECAKEIDDKGEMVVDAARLSSIETFEGMESDMQALKVAAREEGLDPGAEDGDGKDVASEEDGGTIL